MSKGYRFSGVFPKGTQGNTDGRWAINFNVVVLETSIDAALLKFRERYPEAAVDGIKHIGAQEYLL